MLLIMCLSLIAKITSVTCNCDVGISEVQNFDWYEVSGPRPWYPFWHIPNDIENDLACVVVIYGSPEGNTSLVTVHAYQISEQRPVTISGKAINWNSINYWDEVFQPLIMWIGRHYVIAVDYDRYLIFKHCNINFTQTFVYVFFRSTQPNEETLEKVKNELKENDIDFSQLVEWPEHPCQKAELPTK